MTSYKGKAYALDVVHNKVTKIIESSNGLKWNTVATIGDGEPLAPNLVSSTNGLLYIDGPNVWTSKNGTSWRKVKTNMPNQDGVFSTVDVYKDTYFAMKETPQSSQDTEYFVSPDGVHWTEHEVPLFALQADAFANNGVQAYGKNIFVRGSGVIMTLSGVTSN